jgi:urea transporter/murein DD-endopeptidase MepM/ murein hydrolase activator NlpD
LPRKPFPDTLNKSPPGKMKVSAYKKNSILLYQGLLNSYSQVFFSDHRVFAWLALLVTFIDSFAGLCGLTAVVITNLVGLGLGYDKNRIARGFYGFNSLLVGLGLGIYFAPGLLFFMVLILAAILTFFLCVSLEGVIGKYGIPYLSVPFILALWILSIASREFTALGISERGIYSLNDLYILGGQPLVDLYEWWNNLNIPTSVKTYFISLGAIFFQFNVLSGIIIAIGLLYYSRIGFSLSILGFYAAYVFYELIGADLNEVNYSYIGFNFILTSIAIGGFFIIPSRLSYLWTILLVPIVAIMVISLSTVFAVFQLPIYSLPFNIVVLLFLYSLKLRVKIRGNLHEVYIQQNSPEKNLYSFQNHSHRFRERPVIPIHLPFWGEWTVSQGHDGRHTHKGAWRHAWDFIIQNDAGKQFKENGDFAEDYYCYGKAVLAPGDGVVEEVVDGVPENKIGDVNLQDNWGNTIIIRHSDYLYSKLSHLKTGSIEVRSGDRIKTGQVLAKCGNSGRSPYPHLHFQLQSTPYIGSGTLDYPINHFLVSEKEIVFYDRPEEGQSVSKIEPSGLIGKALDFIPGKEIKFEVRRGPEHWIETWLVDTTPENHLYINSDVGRGLAYFENDDHVFYFTHFTGKRSSLLYQFYLGCYKLQKGAYHDIIITDTLPINKVLRKPVLFFQDFLAPFKMILNAKFEGQYTSVDNDLSPKRIEFKSTISTGFTGREKTRLKNTLILGPEGFEQFEVDDGNTKIDAVCIDP